MRVYSLSKTLWLSPGSELDTLAKTNLTWDNDLQDLLNKEENQKTEG